MSLLLQRILWGSWLLARINQNILCSSSTGQYNSVSRGQYNLRATKSLSSAQMTQGYPSCQITAREGMWPGIPSVCIYSFCIQVLNTSSLRKQYVG